MIEIIRPGDINLLDPKYKCICSKCKCEFTCNANDFKFDIRDGDAYIICPTTKCGNFIWDHKIILGT